jgi:hypothetical protein
MYNALDNIAKAEALRDQMRLEEMDLRSSLEYEEATSNYEPDDSDYDHLKTIILLIDALSEYLRDKRV